MMNISPAEFISTSLSLPILSLNIISSLILSRSSKINFLNDWFFRDVIKAYWNTISADKLIKKYYNNDDEITNALLMYGNLEQQIGMGIY